ncbi:hypothetical protein [Mycolicibacterium bacteremicum]|uniref:hypothetical protein n=1 Tax=Mycolicibacterium bacteremicum TaxID=564198 RepID=UPI0026F20A51|nr:hypothetical protein [Mycolicibacterium bacteremicum]MBX9921990.1 hypothetical protein [Mycolicibacterium frederiksbergense]
MSIVTACARTAEVIGHARSLYGGGPTPTPDCTARLRKSAEETIEAGRRTRGLTGATVDAYRQLDARVASSLATAAQSDALVSAYLDHAATAVRAGSARLDELVEENNATMAAAQRARTPAEEAVILRALRYQVSRTQQIVTDTRQQASGVAIDIHSVDYQTDTQPQPSATTSEARSEGNSSSPDDQIVRADDERNDAIHLVDFEPPQTPAPPGEPVPTPDRVPQPTALPSPLQDFTDYQLQGQQVPGWSPPPPPVTGAPIRLPSSAPSPPSVIDMGVPGTEGLFPNCDGGDATKAGLQIVAGGLGAAVAGAAGFPTGGTTWASLGIAGLAIGDGIDNLSDCIEVP